MINFTVILLFSFHHSYLPETFPPRRVNKRETMFSYLAQNVKRLTDFFPFLKQQDSSLCFQNIPVSTRVQSRNRTSRRYMIHVRIFIARNWLTYLCGLARQIWKQLGRLSGQAGALCMRWSCYLWVEFLLQVSFCS